MKRKYVLAVVVTFVLIGMFGIKSVSGQRTVGVGVCDWAEYTVSYSGNETLPPQLPPGGTELKLTVEDISGTNISFEQIWHATNGTEVSGINSVDVETGQGNGTGLFIAKNLNESDVIYSSPPPSGPFGLNLAGMTINETLSRQYLGTAVEVNHLNIIGNVSSPEGNATLSYNFYWYRATGIVAEMSVSVLYQWVGNTTWLEWGVVVSAMEVLPQRYSVGVKAGDWVGYGDISFEWSSNVTGQEPPSQMNMSWIDMKILDVQNSNVTAQVVTILKNGTEETLTDWVNVATGEGAMGMTIIPSNLSMGDRIPGSLKWYTAKPLKLFINGTATRCYAHANREVNFAHILHPVVYGNITYGSWNISLYWDQKTGVLCEEITSYAIAYSVNSTNYYMNMSINYRMTATNIWQAVFAVQDGYEFNIAMTSNSTISNFNYSESSMQISFNVTGPTGKDAYCNVTIPKGLLQGSPWIVYLNSTDYTVSCSITGNDTHTFIYIPYTCSTHTIKIKGTWAVPEFPSFLILPLFMIATLSTLFVYKRKMSFRT